MSFIRFKEENLRKQIFHIVYFSDYKGNILSLFYIYKLQKI